MVNMIAAGLAALFGFGAIALVIVLLVYVFFSFQGKKKIDRMYILYRELTHQAKIEKAVKGKDYRGPEKLYRMNFPFLGTLNATIKDAYDQITAGKKKDEYAPLLERLDNVVAAVNNCKSCIPKGDITGYNKINLGATFEEAYKPREVTVSEKEGVSKKVWVADFGEYKDEISNEEKEEVKRMLQDAGNFLNVIVYEIDFGWKFWPLFKDREEHTVLCFDTQIADINSQDGRACLLGAGTEYYAYFEIPSGYPEMTKVMHYATKTLLSGKMLSQLLGEQFEMVNKILDYEPAFKRTLAIEKASQPIVQKTVKD